MDSTMEISTNSVERLRRGTRKKGGLITVPFIIANAGFERVATTGAQTNMILYLTGQYHFDSATAYNILFWWGAITNFLPTLGAFLSDSCLGRFRVIAMGSLVTLAGQTALWLTAILPKARPPYCEDDPNNCVKPNSWQLLLLISAFGLLSIGTGGIQPCSLAFGADQFDDPDNPGNGRILQTFFNWYFASLGVAVMIALTVIAYIQNNHGWGLGFGIPVLLMLISTIIFLLGSKLYVKIKADKGLMAGFAQVMAVAWKNKHLTLPPSDSHGLYYHRKDSKIIHPTQRLRFLNKACMVTDKETNPNPEGSISDPWKACTVEQVENLKALIKVIPIWSTGIILGATLSQYPIYVQQASTMDRRIYGNVKIPGATMTVFAVLSVGIWVTVYDRLLVPRIAKYTKNPRGLSYEQRIGIGLFMSCIAMTTVALVERKRRNVAIKQGVAENPFAVVNMSVFWQVPQYCLIGLAEAFNAIGQTELYYSLFPKNMSSIGVSILALGFAVGNLVGSFIVMVVKRVSGRGKHIGWLANNLNQGHYDYYFWILTAMSVVNFLYFMLLILFCNSCSDEELISDDGKDRAEETKEEESANNSLGNYHHV
ncbi:OLC1v1037351C1 [Oldenlandia corymbosa var. corymbosa]|uniref:OLC1v1037351C1 n=1 Tax=Oldenlandia corymbosa var. corymbosa TaxID=529605 RepID=A0AAV1CY51_OLDCO|nr:OLC1v1037351C1 [Oldenlandia corymbosa var. corymbosa]